MEQIEQLKSNSWVTDFKLFAGTTTAHGVNQIFEGRNKFVRLLFLLAWAACVIYSTYIITSSVIIFFDKPTGTKYEVVLNEGDNGTKPQSIKFPTISICSHNKVKKSFLHQEGNEPLHDYWETVDQYDVEKAANINWTDPNMVKIQDMTYQDLIAAGGPDDNRFLMCQQRAALCQKWVHYVQEDYFTRDVTSTGKCWRINPAGLIKGKGGDYGKMTIMMFADTKDYSLRATDQAQHGFIVSFHDNTTYGVTKSSGYYMSPGSIYKVDLRLKKEMREPPPGGKCNASLVNTTYGAYDEGSCVLECKDRFVNDTCGCVNIEPPLNNLGYQSCTLKQWAQCGLEAYLNFNTAYMNPDLEEELCTCQSACLETHYEAQMSSSSVSKGYTKSLHKSPDIKGMLAAFSHPELNFTYKSEEDIRDNMVIIEVLFTSMSTSEIREVVTYTSANLLGDIGGVLGLFMGASVFTLIEFVQLLFFAIQKNCISKWCGSGKDEKEKDRNENTPTFKVEGGNGIGI
ncbi:acid-sensing ion channel 1C-like [Bolinopsis microptera]|uniref:acid-sensing ion channel 1C-like n=1 Tax=Bolinopsis microptera TaxID=2820187 RepID=UPI00307A7E61